MITRTIRAENMLTALEVIKKELGPDALVVSARQIMSGPSWQVWRKPLVEVVAVKMAEGEPTEQLKAAIAQRQFQVPNGPDQPLESVQTMTQNASLDLPIAPEMNVRPSVVARKYQLLETPPDSQEKEAPKTEIPGMDTSEPLVPSTAKVKAAAPVQENRKKEISKPIFERIVTGSATPGSGAYEKEEPLGTPDSFRDAGPSRPANAEASLLNLPPMVLKTYQYLLRHGLDEGLLKRVAFNCVDTLNPRAVQEKARVWENMEKQLAASIRSQDETIGMMSRVIFLTGTSGVGKTSALAKLAVHLSANHQRKVGWICADTVKIGAIAESRTYAETIGLPLQVVYTPQELQGAINEFLNEEEFILVDTAAYNPRNEQSVTELGEMLTAYPRRCTWVVLPATAKENDLQNALASVGPFKPRGLIISKLDETNNFSAVFNIAWRSQLPLVYFSYGSRVINDLMPARSEQLVRAAFDERFTP